MKVIVRFGSKGCELLKFSIYAKETLLVYFHIRITDGDCSIGVSESDGII